MNLYNQRNRKKSSLLDNYLDNWMYSDSRMFLDKNCRICYCKYCYRILCRFLYICYCKCLCKHLYNLHTLH